LHISDKEQKMAFEDLNFNDFEKEIERVCQSVSDEKGAELMRREWLGSKGVMKTLFQKLAILPPEEKIEVAKRLNVAKSKIEAFVSGKELKFLQAKQKSQLAKEYLDLSLPAKNPGAGNIHPIRRTERQITALLKPFGFTMVEGPEIESEYYCFDALNIPPHHPARDMQDTFYTTTEHVLRTHTTSVQSRELEKGKLPLKVIASGRVYRNEADDSSHQSMFHQYELVWLEEGLTISHLMALLTHVLHGLYGVERRIRFVPKYYPYTEPSIGAQIDCSLCQTKGCSFCKGSGWVTIVGAGMIHENVLREFHYDPKVVTGMAFGFGLSRLASQAYHLPHMKSLYINDLRVLRTLS
jgi:phenylalanyl-tRNA synthetase alpha chain